MDNSNENISPKPGIAERFKQWIVDNKVELTFAVLGVAVVAVSIGLGEHSLIGQTGHISDLIIPGISNKP